MFLLHKSFLFDEFHVSLYENGNIINMVFSENFLAYMQIYKNKVKY